MGVASQGPVQSLEQFAEVVRQHQSGVCAAAYGVTGDRALSEDIAQETFIAAWRSLATLHDPSKLRAWLRGIARNLAYKARRKVAPVEQLGDLVAGDDLARDAIARDQARLVWAAMRELPETYREALVLYYWEDQSARQLAEALGITEAAAMQRLSRGRALLRDEVQRLVEGTLRRARPGAVLTAAILAAVAATAAGTAPAAAGAGATPLAGGAGSDGGSDGGSGGGDVSRRTIWKTGLTLVGMGALGAFGGPIAVWSGRRRETGADGPPPATAVPLEGSRDTSSTAMLGDAPTSSLDGAPRAADPLVPGDDPELGDPMSASVTSDDEPAGWVTGKLLAALSLCFVDELVDHPCRIDVEVRDGKIATTMVEPFDGASRRVVVRTLEDVPTPLAPPDLLAWLAAGKLIAAVRDEPQLADHDQAMQVGELVGLCAKARLEGLPVAGPEGTRHLWFSWIRDVPRTVDRQAYLDLDVAAGASRGPASAPVTIVSFLDVADPWGFGGKAVAALRAVLARYPEDVRVVVKLCPLCPEHGLAAEAVHAARAQGALWPMLELVAANPEHVALDDLVGYATTLGLDSSRFRSDLELHTFRDVIELDQDQREGMDIEALPSALLNGKRVHGALPASVYVTAVAKALRAHSSAPR
jgi:RNA polymerase sigma factor (sigma-70 family)